MQVIIITAGISNRGTGTHVLRCCCKQRGVPLRVEDQAKRRSWRIKSAYFILSLTSLEEGERVVSVGFCRRMMGCKTHDETIYHLDFLADPHHRNNLGDDGVEGPLPDPL